MLYTAGELTQRGCRAGTRHARCSSGQPRLHSLIDNVLTNLCCFIEALDFYIQPLYVRILGL